MSYKVINEFIDKEDKTHYKVGDKFPKGSKKPTKKRVNELIYHSTYRKAFIEEVNEEE